MRAVRTIGIILALAGFTTPCLAADETFENWFQVDAIVFRPLTGGVDDETWAENTFSYPHDVVDINAPRPFNLSTLNSLAADTQDAQPLEPVPGIGEFAFQTQSRGEYSRDIVEAAQGIDQPETIIDEAMPAENDLDIDSGIDSDIDLDNVAEPVAVDLDALLIPGETQGQLAWADPLAESALKDVLRSLNRSSRYRVLSESSWLQPVSGKPSPILVQAGKRYDDLFEVEGTLSVSLSRYLHVQADLFYTVFEPRGIVRSETSAANNIPLAYASEYVDLAEVERQRGQYYPARTLRMNQSRRMRSGELHYLDHPLFGVLLYISRFEGTDEPLEQ